MSESAFRCADGNTSDKADAGTNEAISCCDMSRDSKSSLEPELITAKTYESFGWVGKSKDNILKRAQCGISVQWMLGERK